MRLIRRNRTFTEMKTNQTVCKFSLFLKMKHDSRIGVPPQRINLKYILQYFLI